VTRRLKFPMKAPGPFSTRLPTGENHILLDGMERVRSEAARALGMASSDSATPEQRRARASAGGRSTADRMTPEQRKDRAAKAGRARWAKRKATAKP
jgi:hypothetical protein